MRRSLALLLLCAFHTACAPPSTGECVTSGDCGPTTNACEGCPAEGDALCVGAACVSRGPDAVDVTGTVSIDRDIADRVESFVHAIVSTDGPNGEVGCGEALSGGSVAPAVNVLAAGFKNVSGGSFHPDVNLGRAPEQRVVVVVVAHEDAGGRGAALGSGCEGPLDPDGGSLVIEILNVVP